MNTSEKRAPVIMSLEGEENLIRLAQKDSANFRALYNNYFPKIASFVIHRVGDRDTAFDITQQVFFKALTGLHKFEFRGLPFSSWLYRVAINECNEYFRKSNRVRFVTIGKDSVQDLHDELTEDTTLEDLELRMPEILQQLSLADLTMIEMRYFEKRTFAEIAGILNLSETGTKVRIYRILKKMKKLFLS